MLFIQAEKLSAFHFFRSTQNYETLGPFILEKSPKFFKDLLQTV
jgi:hypothetical protein